MEHLGRQRESQKMTGLKISVRRITEKNSDGFTSLWRDCFDDGFGFIYRFLYRKDIISIAAEDSGRKIVGMMHLIPAWLVVNKKAKRAYYGYALAVSPEKRGEGIGKAILSFAYEYVKTKKGILFVRPGEDELVSYYAAFGMTVFSTCGYKPLPVKRYKGEGISVGELGGVKRAFEYRSMRDELYSKGTYIRWSEDAVAFALDDTDKSNGTVLCAESDEKRGVIQLFRNGSTGTILETTFSDAELYELSPSICMTAGVKDLLIRDNGEKPLCMAIGTDVGDAYTGLLLDC